MQKNSIDGVSDSRPLEEFSGMAYEEVVKIIIERRKKFPSNSLQSKRMRRLEEESLLMKRSAELSYRHTLVHFDI